MIWLICLVSILLFLLCFYLLYFVVYVFYFVAKKIPLFFRKSHFFVLVITFILTLFILSLVTFTLYSDFYYLVCYIFWVPRNFQCNNQFILLFPFLSSTFLLFSVVLFVRLQYIFFHPCHHLYFSLRFTIKPSINHQSFAKNVPSHLLVGWSLSSGKFLRKGLYDIPWFLAYLCCCFFVTALIPEE